MAKPQTLKIEVTGIEKLETLNVKIDEWCELNAVSTEQSYRLQCIIYECIGPIKTDIGLHKIMDMMPNPPGQDDKGFKSDYLEDRLQTWENVSKRMVKRDGKMFISPQTQGDEEE